MGGGGVSHVFCQITDQSIALSESEHFSGQPLFQTITFALLQLF